MAEVILSIKSVCGQGVSPLTSPVFFGKLDRPVRRLRGHDLRREVLRLVDTQYLNLRFVH
jgi:hypothetical protein